MGRTRKIYNKKLGKKKLRKTKRQKKSRRKSRRHLRKKVSVGGKHTRGGYAWQWPVFGKSKKDVYKVLDDLMINDDNDDNDVTISEKLEQLLPDSICYRLAENVRSMTTDLVTDGIGYDTKAYKLITCKEWITNLRQHVCEFIFLLRKGDVYDILLRATYLFFYFNKTVHDYSRVRWSTSLQHSEQWVWDKARWLYSLDETKTRHTQIYMEMKNWWQTLGRKRGIPVDNMDIDNTLNQIVNVLNKDMSIRARSTFVKPPKLVYPPLRREGLAADGVAIHLPVNRGTMRISYPQPLPPPSSRSSETPLELPSGGHLRSLPCSRFRS
jgi:hypothetical protein